MTQDPAPEPIPLQEIRDARAEAYARGRIDGMAAALRMILRRDVVVS